MNSHRPLPHGHHHGAPLPPAAMIERSGGVSVVVNPRFEVDKQAWEDAIRGYNGNDPLDLWFNYITWYEQNRFFDRTNNLRSIVEKCLSLYQDTEGYKQDTRMIKIWMKYTNMQQSPASIYHMLYKRNIGTQCASFYIGWAESAYKQAESIYNRGIQMNAQPIEELHEAQRNYRLYNESLAKKRSASSLVEQRQQIPSQSPPQKRLKQEPGNYQLHAGTNGAVIHHEGPNGTFANQQQQHQSHAYYHQQKASGSYYLPENTANGGTYYTSNGQEQPYQPTNSLASTESGPSSVPVTSSVSASSSQVQQPGQHQALSSEESYHAAPSNSEGHQQQDTAHRTESETRAPEYQPTDDSIIECNLNNSAYVISSSLSYVYDDPDLVQYPVAEEIPRPVPADTTEPSDQQTSQEPAYDSDAIRLPPNFAREAKSNHETWDVPLCLEEPYDPNRQCCYPKHLVYPDLHAERPTMEFSLEEIRAQRWLERKRQQEEQRKLQEEEEEAQRQAKAAQLEKEKQMRQMQQMKYQQQQQQQRMYNAQQYSSNASGHMPIGQTMQTQPNNSYHSPQQMRQGSIQHTSNFYHQQQQQPYHGYSNGCYGASSPQMQPHQSYQQANVPAATVIQNHHHHHHQQHSLHHQQQQTHHHHQQQHHSPVPASHMHSPSTTAAPYVQHGQHQHHYAPVNHHHGHLHSPQPYHVPYENYNHPNSYPAGHQPVQQPQQQQQQQEVTTPQRTYQSMTNVLSPYGYGSPGQQEAIAPRTGNAHYAMAPQTPPNHQLYPQSPGHQHTHHGHHHQQQHAQLGMVGASPQPQSNRGHSVPQQSPHQEHPYNHHQHQQHPHHTHPNHQYTTVHYNANEQQHAKPHAVPVAEYAQNCTPDSAKLNPPQHNYKQHGLATVTVQPETQPTVNGGLVTSGSYINNAQERHDHGAEHPVQQLQQNNNHGKYNNANNCDDFEEQIEASTIRFSTPTENGITRKQTITIKFKKEKTGLSLAMDSPSSPAGAMGESSGAATTAPLDQQNEQQQVPASAPAVTAEDKSKKHKKHTQPQRTSETGTGKFTASSSSSAKGKHSRKKQSLLSVVEPGEHHMDDANLLLSFSRPEKDEDSCLSAQSQTDASSVGSKKKKKSKRSKSGAGGKDKRRRHRYDLDEEYRVEEEEDEEDEEDQGNDRSRNGVLRARVLGDEYSEATVGGYEEDDDGVEDQYYEVEEEENEQENGVEEEEEEEEEEDDDDDDDDEEEYYGEEETSREATQRRRTIGSDRRAAGKRLIRPDEDDSSYQSNSEINTSFSNISFAGDNSNGPYNYGGSNCSTPVRRTQTSGGGGGGAFSKTSTPVGSFRYLRKQETNLSTLGQNDDSMNSTVVESSFFQANSEHDEEARRRRLDKALGTIETHLGRPFVDPFNSELCRAFLTKVDFPSRTRDPADNYHLSNANLPKLLKGQTANLGGTGYSIEKEVGRGSYGSVFRAINTQTGAVVAIKYQKPANTWELYICTEVKKRLTNLKMLPGFMDISAAVIAPNASVLVSEFSQYGSLLDINNKIRTAATRKVMHESLVMHFSCQILSIVEYLHACNIIHADIKPDNFLLMKIPSRDLEEPTLRLIDFGCAIDMNFFEPKRQFKKVIQTDGFTCIEMQEGRPWSYQTDLFCVAGTIHVMLFGEYMQLVKKYESGWDIKQKLPRYLKKHVWTEVFQKLLNIKDIDHMPSLPDLRRLINEEAYKMDSELATHIRSLSNLLKSR